MDVPGKEGYEVLSMVKKDPDLRQIPVVIFSDSDSAEDIQKAYTSTPTLTCESPSMCKSTSG
jgi:CheY-like chemotaxis protein